MNESRWAPGTLVIEKGAEDDPHALRMVIGYDPQGRCKTVYVNHLPWVEAGVLVGGALVEVDPATLPEESPVAEQRPSQRFRRWMAECGDETPESCAG